MLVPVRCKSALEIRALPAENEWALTAPLHWETLTLDVKVPAGFITDLASIPRALQNVLSVTGKSRRAAVAHDWLYCVQSVSRNDADQFLRRALICEGMGSAQARVYWLGVRAGGWLAWNKRLKRGGGLHDDDFIKAAP